MLHLSLKLKEPFNRRKKRLYEIWFKESINVDRYAVIFMLPFIVPKLPLSINHKHTIRLDFWHFQLKVKTIHSIFYFFSLSLFCIWSCILSILWPRSKISLPIFRKQKEKAHGYRYTVCKITCIKHFEETCYVEIRVDWNNTPGIFYEIKCGLTDEK